MVFGRKQPGFADARGSLEGYVPPVQPQARPLDPGSRAAEEPREGISMLKLAGIGLGAILFLLTMDALAAGTTLITPLPDGASFNASATGAALGLLIGGYLWFTNPAMRGLRASLGMLFGMPLLVGGWANMMLWRVVEHAEFAFADTAWERAAYPIEYFDRPSRKAFGFSRHAVEIDPFDVGGNTDIPIPEWQYEMHWLSNDGLCVIVEQRRSASGAIQVRTDGNLNFSEPVPVDFVPCPSVVERTSR